MSKNARSSIKDKEQYEALRDQGASKEKAARIANTPRHKAAKRGGKAAAYEHWNKNELYQRAQEIGITGRSKLNKQELIKALREH
ncbi:DUF7218 family protein [Gilvimarinus chinensis]|uniref:DUF7218 family protein n=1 Tax=Gilvimarinus chinensis TaxID=396005 RepID=UPI00035F76A7|nr:Rho termination factor N-terminal domain-containing protein [Gilvimarinus chinensis]